VGGDQGQRALQVIVADPGLTRSAVWRSPDDERNPDQHVNSGRHIGAA